MKPIEVRLCGDVDLATRDATTAVLDEGVARARSAGADLIVDLELVTFLGSTGISCLVRAREALGEERTLCVRNPAPTTRRVLEVTGLTGLILEGSV